MTCVLQSQPVSQGDSQFWPSESSSDDAAAGAANASTAFCSVGSYVASNSPSIKTRELEASQHASAYAHNNRDRQLGETQAQFVGGTSSALPRDTKASVRGGPAAAGLMLPNMETREEDAINEETVEAWKTWKTLQMKNEVLPCHYVCTRLVATPAEPAPACLLRKMPP